MESIYCRTRIFRHKMTPESPPTIDPIAAGRWQTLSGSPAWLNQEVGRRMAERLQWIRQQPAAWLDWAPQRSGAEIHDQVQACYPKAECYVHEPAAQAHAFRHQLHRPWWQPARWTGPAVHWRLPADGAVQMVWSNMALHLSAQPMALMKAWHQALAVDGFLMFSCLGPDTLKELRVLYAEMGWPVPAHAFTDMHDWGDMLVEAGFAEPVMDMERIVLTYERPQRLLQDLRELGRNLHPQRFGACRGRAWRQQLEQGLATHPALASGGAGQLSLTFEIIYGHAFKPAPRLKMASESVIGLDQMRAELRQGKKNL